MLKFQNIDALDVLTAVTILVALVWTLTFLPPATIGVAAIAFLAVIAGGERDR